ncbi:MAG: hypothetical protein LQ338_001962 [Usnochroma carphineum]|nr:MAG: hypothetical protein LQ338_001962 [Usnochroma carphineum]
MLKTIVYTGAPLSRSLNWDEEQLVAPLQPCFLDAQHSQTYIDIDIAPKWRSLPLEQKHLPTGLTQATNPDFVPEPTRNQEETSFLSTTNYSALPHTQNDNTLSTGDQDSDILSQYYEHSFAVHDDIPSSQIFPATSPSPSSSTYIESDTSIYSDAGDLHQREATIRRFAATCITDLSSVPTASYLHSITPQTMTLNLLIGIISIPPLRTITTRRDSRTVDLVEMIVGDETRAGFGVNVWLPHNHPGGHRLNENKQTQQLRDEMADLRPRDIVMMRNVALTSFRGKVYGQSLRRGMTGVELVWRNVVDEGDRRGVLARSDVERGGEVWVEKVRRVREWVLQFVGGGGIGRDVRRDDDGVIGREGRGRRALPADTQ